MSEEKTNAYNFSFEKMSKDELLKSYIKANRAVFLHGPSGVGKSDRVAQIDPTNVRITLRNGMNPEEIDGTLDRETGKYIPPLWYQEITDICAKEPDRLHVLFIDELTNVKPATQSLVYSIVYDRAGKDGLWPLPENCAVVAAGNENADNLAAYPMTNALFRRFSHIYYDVNLNDWLAWAMKVERTSNRPTLKYDKENKDRAKVHPAIVAFMLSRKEQKILNQDLDEENPKIVTDPRKWKIASDILYATNNPNALEPAIGEELTTDFVDFVQSIHITVESIVNKKYTNDDIKAATKNMATKMASVSALTCANEKELPLVRSFIAKNFGKEELKTYDLLWIQNDPDRASILSDVIQSFEENYSNKF